VEKTGSVTVEVDDKIRQKILERLKTSPHTSGIAILAISPDGKTIASGSWDKSVKLWDVANGQRDGFPVRSFVLDPRALPFHRTGRCWHHRPITAP